MKPGTDNKKFQVFPVNGIAGVMFTLCPRKRHEAHASKRKRRRWVIHFDPEEGEIAADNYYEHDYAVYNVIEIEHNYVRH